MDYVCTVNFKLKLMKAIILLSFLVLASCTQAEVKDISYYNKGDHVIVAVDTTVVSISKMEQPDIYVIVKEYQKQNTILSVINFIVVVVTLTLIFVFTLFNNKK